MNIRLRYREEDNVYVRMFTSRLGPGTPHFPNGRLAFTKEEWEAFKTSLVGNNSTTVELINCTNETDCSFDEPRTDKASR